ncbi:MAG: HEAT repeat domain-containing protein, partial [Candidatus Solibacter usitatus]|nr:HEAT repeat domain-containing protein [Candidatus Solibacter usitatus]
MLSQLRATFKFAFDVRKGEGPRTFFMALYMMFILWAYYILKPISQAMFVDSFDVDKIPRLLMLIAVAGGLIGFYYTKLAVKTSLQTAVLWTSIISVACLVALWWMLGRPKPWMLYAFNIWVSLFSISIVSQGWLVAANIFDPREAKRLYGLLGLSQVVGAFVGGIAVTKGTDLIGDSRNWLLASAGVVVLSYGAFRCVLTLKGVSLAQARAADSEEANVSLVEILGELRRNRHLQLIMAIITLMFIVDTSVQYQFSVMAKAAYKGKELTKFMAAFTGIYTNLITFTLQFFLSAAVFTRLGVGGVLQLMPVGLSLTSFGSLLVPGLWSASINRLAETGLRYSLNKSAMELLYLPLPVELKNRTKAFVDIFIDRFGRGLGGSLLFLVTVVLGVGAAKVPAMIMLFCVLWSYLAWRAQKEYLRTVRGRLDKRRLDLESRRFTLTDAATISIVEQAAQSPNARQACYALSLLAEAPAYDLAPILTKLAASPLEEVRGKVYDIARASGIAGLLDSALAEARRGAASRAVKPAVAYALGVSASPAPLVGEFLDLMDLSVVEATLEALGARPELAGAIGADWLAGAAGSADPSRRALAAQALGIRGEEGIDALGRLLEDPEPLVASAACRAAGRLHNRAYIHVLAGRLAEPAVRAAAIEGLAAFGTRVCGTLGDMLEDDSVALPIRRQIPRVLKLIPDQRSIDVL